MNHNPLLLQVIHNSDSVSKSKFEENSKHHLNMGKMENNLNTESELDLEFPPPFKMVWDEYGNPELIVD